MSKKLPTTVWIARHGERQDYVDRQWYQRPQRAYDDPPLADKGREQANELGQRLAGERIDRIVSSPFQRCVKTAHLVSEQRPSPLPVNVEPGICEVLLTFPPGFESAAELKQRFPLVNLGYTPTGVQLAEEDHDRACLPRVRAALERLLPSLGDDDVDNVLLVGHGASVGAACQSLCGRWQYVGLTTLCKFTLSNPDATSIDSYKAQLLNDSSHLSDQKYNLRAY